ncbi:hypothetical protein ACVIIW_004038 [Bradyrhizobium sp. USDA 4449]
MLPKIQNASEVIVGELAVPGNWIVGNIETTGSWPVKSQKVIYRGREIWILPIAHDLVPAVAARCPPSDSREDCERLLMRFLSALAWVNRTGILVSGFGGGGLPRQMRHESSLGISICQDFDLQYLPEPTDDKALLALALMREGRGLNHPGYSFLSFYRVLEVALGQGKKRQIEWINDQITHGLGHYPKDAIDGLRQQGIADIGAHLYESGRCAIAHAAEEPIIDPDDPIDARRLWTERPLMLELAERAIEEKLGVETAFTVYDKHLYELEGFKRVLGEEIVGHLVRADDPPNELMVDIPNIGVRIRKHEPYAPLSNLTIREASSCKHKACLVFALGDDLIRFRVTLDFAEERLHFSLFHDIAYRDDGTAEGAEMFAEVLRFQADLLGNGQLQITNADTGELLSRKDAYLPVNIIQNPHGSDALIARWRWLARKRRHLNSLFEQEMARWAQPYDIRVTPPLGATP